MPRVQLEQRAADSVEVDGSGRVWVDALQRGSIKQALIKLGFPVDDRGPPHAARPYPAHFARFDGGDDADVVASHIPRPSAPTCSSSAEW